MIATSHNLSRLRNNIIRVVIAAKYLVNMLDVRVYELLGLWWDLWADYTTCEHHFVIWYEYIASDIEIKLIEFVEIGLWKFGMIIGFLCIGRWRRSSLRNMSCIWLWKHRLYSYLHNLTFNIHLNQSCSLICINRMLKSILDSFCSWHLYRFEANIFLQLTCMMGCTLGTWLLSKLRNWGKRSYRCISRFLWLHQRRQQLEVEQEEQLFFSFFKFLKFSNVYSSIIQKTVFKYKPSFISKQFKTFI